MVDKFNFGQLTKEIVVSRLPEISTAPDVAAEIAKKTIVSGVRGTASSGQSAQETVEQICLGAMKGLLLIEKDLPRGATQILQRMAEAANDLHLDPNDLMTWAMRGIAGIAPLVSSDVQWKIREQIEASFQGAGEVFSKLCAEAQAKPEA